MSSNEGMHGNPNSSLEGTHTPEIDQNLAENNEIVESDEIEETTPSFGDHYKSFEVARDEFTPEVSPPLESSVNELISFATAAVQFGDPAVPQIHIPEEIIEQVSEEVSDDEISLEEDNPEEIDLNSHEDVDPENHKEEIQNDVSEHIETESQEDTPEVILEAPEMIIPEIYSEEAILGAIQDAPEPIVEEAPEPIVEEAPETIVEEAPETIVEEAPETIVEEVPEAIVEEVPEAIVEEPPEVIDTTIEDAKESISEDIPEEIIEDVVEDVKDATNLTNNSNNQPQLSNINSETFNEPSGSVGDHIEPSLNSIASFLGTNTESLSTIDHGILSRIQAKINEVAVLKSDKLVLEVNLEQATHLGNKRADLIKMQLQKIQKENASLKEKSLSLEASKFEVQKKLSDLELELKAKNNDDIDIKLKLDNVLSENRKTIDLLEKKNNEIKSLKSEYNDIQESNSKLRKELINLETSSQSANSSVIQLKLKVQSSESQIELINKNNDWLNNELQKITADFAEYRKQKSAELLSLQSEHDSSTTELNSLKLRYDALNSRFAEVSGNLDNSLLEIKKLTDEKTLNEEEFFNEVSVKDRLTNLLKQSNTDLKEKVDYLQGQLEGLKSEAANESAGLTTILDNYKAKLEQSEAKINRLEETIDELSRTVPSENDSFLSAVPTLSPSAKIAAAKTNGISLSQLYSDFTIVKRQLVQERRSKERMQQQIDAFVSELERKAPLIKATKERASILEKELTHLSVILENTSKEKEELEKSKKSLAIELGEAHSQISSLNKQRVDLARQVQNLLVQVTIRGDSYGPLTPAEQQALVRIANGDKVLNESDSDKLISERLVVFQNITELQKKNEELLRIIRDLGEKLESQEKTSRSRLEDLENSAVNEAKEAILTLNEEIETIESKLSAVTRERDMFRSMLAGKGSASASNILGSNNISNDEVAALNEKYKTSQHELSTIQTDFNYFKAESNTTIQLLNKQLESLGQEKSQLAVSLAKEKSTGILIDERYKTLQENLKLARSEADELRKRSQILQENLAKQDLRTQQVAEELIQSRSFTESLRSETSNLKAEKQLWKTIEVRLTEENSSLIEEKAKLNMLLLNVQALEREREANALESQRRLVLQSESLEKELSNLREKLVVSADELKVIIAKKESDAQAYQERIENLRTELSSTREELIIKKATVESLESKVESLTEKLSSTESDLRDYQNVSSNSGSQSVLVNETIRLRSELQEVKSELEEATSSVEKFKLIAESSEEALNSINSSFDSYKENTGNTISKLESSANGLREQISILNEQINALNAENLSTKAETSKKVEFLKKQNLKLQEQNKENSKIKEEYDLKVAAIEESYQQQAIIASEAQKNYEKELQKHIDVAKAVSSLREESNNLKLQVQQFTAESNAVKEELVKSQESWDSQRNTLEEELRVATSRVQDLTSQNRILYSQIDSLSKQGQSNLSLPGDEFGELDGANDDLRQLISLLRREKETADTQLDVASRDLKRVRQQLAIANTELDKVRLELVKSQATDANIDKLTKEHDHLLQELQQLNLLRESNTTLRSELQLNISKVKLLESNLTAAEARVEPLETEVVQLRAEISSKSQEISLVIEEKERWKLRSQEILNKYDRIDPQEHDALKKERESLLKSLEAEVAKTADLESRLNKLRTEAQEKINRRGNENKILQTQLSETDAELKKVKESSESSIAKLSAEIKTLSSKSTGSEELLKKQVDDLSKELKTKNAELTKTKELQTKLNEATALVNQLKTQISKLEQEIDSLKSQLKIAKESGSVASNGVTDANLVQFQEDLKSAKAEIAKLHELLEVEKQEAIKAKEESAKAKDEYSTKLELHKQKIRAPSQEKLEQIAEKRAMAVKQEAEAEAKKRLDDQKKQNQKAFDNMKKQLEGKLNKVIADQERLSAESYNKGKTEGRDGALKEGGMRTKLLQGKLDRLSKEKVELEAKLAAISNPNTSNNSSKAVTPSAAPKTFEIPAKPVLQVKSDDSNAGNKRPADEPESVGSPEKKVKSDS